MCTHLWRRYTCPRAPEPKPSSELASRPGDNPSIKQGARVTDKDLVAEEENIFREHDPASGDAETDPHIIHWVYNLIRCAHRHPSHCRKWSCVGTKIQHFDGPCPWCTGEVDPHVPHRREATLAVVLPLPTPLEDPPTLASERLAEFQEYRGAGIPTYSEVGWERTIRHVWPEIFCQLQHEHIGRSEAQRYECDGTAERWRTNAASDQRESEATAILRSFLSRGGPGGDRSLFRNAWYLWLLATSPTGMTFVYTPGSEYRDRFALLTQLADQRATLLIERGKAAESQEDVPNAGRHQSADWGETIGLRNTLPRRMPHHLAQDDGLHKSLMKYLGTSLLAVLNPWPKKEVTNHASYLGHRGPHFADRIHKDLQDIVERVEVH
ncbi:hypothetical protein LX36DRAFT_714463 [Colletotrichum falcatum]|nr:hypothetical protein LX36DRAFT_714463 [Colletotrichum falcatum]